MLGQIVYSAQAKGRLRLEREEICGMPVLRVALEPDGMLGRVRMRRAGKLLVCAGVRRVLVPEQFGAWESLSRRGLRPVDPTSFLQANADVLTLAALRKAGKLPEREQVAVRAVRVQRWVRLAAEALCQQVREVCIGVQEGGAALEQMLRWEYGMAVCPDSEQVSAALRFDAQTWETGKIVLNLFPPDWKPANLQIAVPGADLGETERFPLLAALWEGGKLQKADLEFT